MAQPHPAHLLASEGSIFDSGFRKPANEQAVGSRPRGEVAEVVPWRVVETFLVMAREAQRVRSEAFTELQHKLEAAHERLREEMQERSLVGSSPCSGGLPSFRQPWSPGWKLISPLGWLRTGLCQESPVLPSQTHPPLLRPQVARQEVAAEAESSFLTTEVQALLLEKQQLKDRVRQLERENQFLVEENSLLHRQVEGARGGGRESHEGERSLLASRHREGRLVAQGALGARKLFQD